MYISKYCNKFRDVRWTNLSITTSSFRFADPSSESRSTIDSNAEQAYKSHKHVQCLTLAIKCNFLYNADYINSQIYVSSTRIHGIAILRDEKQFLFYLF